MDIEYPIFILGPCAIENEKMLWQTATELKEIAKRQKINFIFKASYDKANRSSINSKRGIGIEKGCELLSKVRNELGIKITTDIHSAEQAKIVANSVDIIQIPAFLCRQTDIIQAAADTGLSVSVKKGQFLSPWDLKNIADKLQNYGCQNFFFIERGTSFGYGNLVVDMRSLYWVRQLGYRIVFDATHSVQRPGSLGDTTGGDRELAPVLARAAVAAGCDGVFLEVHPDPDSALSDSQNQIKLSEIENHIATLVKIFENLPIPLPDNNNHKNSMQDKPN